LIKAFSCSISFIFFSAAAYFFYWIAYYFNSFFLVSSYYLAYFLLQFQLQISNFMILKLNFQRTFSYRLLKLELEQEAH
jgi:hypothetical protein